VRAEEGNLVDILHRGLADDDVGAVLPVMAALSDLWTIEGSHLKVVNHAGAVVGLATGAEVPADLADELRVVLAATGLNTLIFSARPAVAAFARLRELGPGERPHTAALVRVLSALAEAGVGGFGDPDLLLPFIGTADRDTARLALQWRTQALENAGRLDEALETGRRCVELSDVADGPWAGALALSQLAGLAMQVGDLAAARLHAEQALPTMEALDATEDLAQLRALLVAVALDEGSVDEAERLMGLIEADDRHRSVFGGRVTVRCGYAEVALARGDVDAGLAGYRAALEAVRGPDTSRGVEMPVELAPWVLYPEAAALAAHLRHGRGAEVPGLRESLRDRVESLLGGGGYLDVPVAGTVLYVLALAELVRPGGPPEDLDLAARLLVLADVFSYNRSLPSLGWAFAADLAERVRPGSLARARSSYAGRAALELRDEARRLVTELH
jgi:hypothetical protein